MARIYGFYKGTLAENPQARLFDRGVCWWPRSKGRFSHVERVVKVPDGTYTGLSSSVRDGGVRAKKIDFENGHWVFVCVPGDPMQGVARFNALLGKPYDYLGLAGFVLPLWLRVSWAWFCSEICAYMEGLDKPYQWHPNRFYAYLTSLPGAKIRDPAQR
jgi:hypothetical protein